MMRSADVDAEIFEKPTSKDCFVQERTVAKNETMTELRTERTFVGTDRNPSG